MFDAVAERTVALTLYTDSYVVRGSIRTRQKRITDILNHADEEFLVVEDAVIDPLGAHGEVIRGEFAQVNLATVLFAVSDVPVEATPELRTPKMAEQALVTVPPFTVIGSIHLLPERALRDALAELTGRFIPVTDATYWSDTVGEPRTPAMIVAVNHARAQIVAPHRVVDPWTGLSTTGAAGGEPEPSA
jgi:Family of unknown function (DUF6812)